MGLPQWLSSKESDCNIRAEGDTGSISGLGRSPGAMHGNSLQYSSLENSMDRGAWQAAVHRFAESDMTEAPWHAYMRAYICMFIPYL